MPLSKLRRCLLPESRRASFADPLELLTGYLDFFEDITLRKIRGLTEDQLRTSTVPSGWTPLGMVKHLACTERYWVRHIFLGEQVATDLRTQAPGQAAARLVHKSAPCRP